MAQTQCPNCGSYKVYVQDQNSGCTWLYTVVVGPIIGLFGCLLAYAALTGFSLGDSDAFTTLGVSLAFFAVGFGPFILVQRAKKNYLVECDTCGRRWDTRV